MYHSSNARVELQDSEAMRFSHGCSRVVAVLQRKEKKIKEEGLVQCAFVGLVDNKKRKVACDSIDPKWLCYAQLFARVERVYAENAFRCISFMCIFII